LNEGNYIDLSFLKRDNSTQTQKKSAIVSEREIKGFLTNLVQVFGHSISQDEIDEIVSAFGNTAGAFATQGDNDSSIELHDIDALEKWAQYLISWINARKGRPQNENEPRKTLSKPELVYTEFNFELQELLVSEGERIDQIDGKCIQYWKTVEKTYEGANLINESEKLFKSMELDIKIKVIKTRIIHEIRDNYSKSTVSNRYIQEEFGLDYKHYSTPKDKEMHTVTVNAR